jgi:hypothetical protein
VTTNRVLKNNKNHPMAMLIVGNKMWNVMLAANCSLAKTMGSRASMIRTFFYGKESYFDQRSMFKLTH